MYAQGFRVNAACTATSPAINYTKDGVLRIVSIHVFKTKMPISNSIT